MTAKLRITIVLTLLFCSVQLNAQTKNTETPYPWYVGVKGGVPLGVSTFTSLGTDSPRIGYNAGIFAGYHYNPIFSAELSATLGKLRLSSDSYYGGNWLGANGDLYLTPVAGEQGQYYRDLYSNIELQQYGLHININLLPLFNRTKNSRFSVMLSPSIYGVGTQATLKTIATHEDFTTKKTQFDIGIGGDISVGYDVTENLTIRLSSGINQVLGGRIDGLEMGDHNSNFIVNNNISISWRFGKKKRSAPPVVAPTPFKKEEIKPVVTPKPIEKPKPVEKVVITDADFPYIYFAFDNSTIDPRQLLAISKSLELLRSNPEITVIIKGYTCSRGVERHNKILSQRRAESVRALLVDNGIDPSRIEIVGAGVNISAQTMEDARRVEVKLIKNNK